MQTEFVDRSPAGEGNGPDPEAGSPDPPGLKGKMSARQVAEEKVVKERAKRIRNDRFADFLTSGLQGVGPLRHERRLQRNKAVFMLVCAFLFLFWVVYRFFL